MRQKHEFQIVGVSNPISEKPSWFEDVLKATFTARTTLDAWGKNYSTKLREEDLCTTDGEEVENYSLVVSDDSAETEICVATNRYNLIQNEEIVDAVTDAIEDMNLDFVGFVRDYKEKVVMDLYPIHNLVMFDSPDVDGEVLSFGLEVRIGHDKTESVKVRPIMRESHDRSVVRGVGEWKKMKHVKPEDVDDKDISTRVYRMFSEATFSLGYMANTFVEDVRESCETYVDFSEEEFTVEEFYQEWLSQDYISNKIVDVAPRKAVQRAGVTKEMVENIPEGETLSMWAIISGYTYAVGSSGMSDGYNRDRCYEVATKALNNPTRLIDDVRESYAEEEEEEVNVEKKAAVMASDMS